MVDVQHFLGADGVMAEQDGGQQCLGVDDGVGVRVVRSTFGGHQQFSWGLFGGFESCRVLTYSIDLRAVMRLFDPIGIPEVECVVGTQATISGPGDGSRRPAGSGGGG